MSWNLDDYEPVEDRLAKFWADHPDGRITTSLLEHSDSRYIVQAHAWRTSTQEYGPDASGLAEETVGSTPVNKTSALENCETSAIGRALANLGYAAKGKRPSREEMDKPARYQSHSDEPAIGKYNCPACGSQVYDNRAENAGTKKPLWKCSNRSCDGGSKGFSWASWEEDPGDAGLIGPAPVRDDFEPRDDVPAPELREDFGPDEAPF
jgi:hypothetical protein